MNLEKANNISLNELALNDEYLNISYADLSEDILHRLRKLASGNKSEFTSLSQYIYQYFILGQQEQTKNIAHTLERISIREMIHLEILSKILMGAGSDPKFCSYIDNNINVCNYWSAGNVTYVKDIVDIMKENIKLENIAIIEYNEILNITSDTKLKEIINRILEDEYSHLDYFNSVLEALIS